MRFCSAPAGRHHAWGDLRARLGGVDVLGSLDRVGWYQQARTSALVRSHVESEPFSSVLHPHVESERFSVH